MSKTCFFTIVSNNYRHFARTLVQSVRANSPAVDAFVAICDSPLAARDPRDDYAEIPIRQLGLPQFDRFTFQYTILELNTAIKPWVIQTLFDRGYERVIYFDPDIRLYGSVEPILERLGGANIVLTPHLTGRLDDGRNPTELAILQSGSYNLGFIALNRCDATREFVAWWQSKLLRDCVVDIPRGLFTDQKWIDLVPGMYPDVHVERDAGWNVAYWNLNHRKVVAQDGSVRVDGRPLLFFHFSGFSPGGRLLSKHQDRFTIEILPVAVRDLAHAYAEDLQRNGIEECRALPYAFARFPGGEPIPDLARRCYREGFDWNEPHPDLWTRAGEAFLLDWLNAPQDRRAPWLTRLAATLYRLRPDLQAAFPDVTGAHSRAYAHWFIEQAPAQERFPDIFIAPLREALGEKKVARASGDKPAGADGVSDVAFNASKASEESALRRVYRSVYRMAWGARRLVKPLTTQAFRHRVRHALLRKAYFDRTYTTPPLVTSPSSAGALHETTPTAKVIYPAHKQERPRTTADAIDSGVNVIGYLTAESGVGESARSMLRILAASGLPVAPINFRVGNLSRMNEAIPDIPASKDLHAVNLFHINADQMFVAHESLGASLFEGRYNIGFWAWELAEFPDAWVPAFDLLDEVWVPSAFCQQAVALKAPIPVLRVPHSVEAPSVSPDRARFGIHGNDVAFLAMCDVLSVPERKNPLGVLDAFRAAFPGTEPVRLLLKVGNVEFQPDIRDRLRGAAQADPRITLLEGYLARGELWSLMTSIDCYVSLHRAEGFGLGMAEAMACGKAVIATGWSGNVDFTRAENALLVDYRLQPLQRDLGPYLRGQLWAEPDIEDAARHMRAIAASADLRERLALRGRATVARELSPAALAPMVAARLAAIHSARVAQAPSE